MEREDNAEDHQTSQEEEGFPDGEDSAEDEIYYQNSQEVERVRLEVKKKKQTITTTTTTATKKEIMIKIIMVIL